MSVLTVHHTTVYRYREPVGLGEHRMMFRPRESHDLRLIQTSLVITPQPARLRWLHDVFDNSVAVATFEGTTPELRFESIVTLEHFENPVPEYPLEEHARTYPFRYSVEDFPNLERALTSHYHGKTVDSWALQFLDPGGSTGTMNILRAMTRGIREQFTYARRAEKGVQTPEETLRNRRGSCRDFAVLMMEAARSLGVASRFVSGYIFVAKSSGLAGGGATHAWMQA
jgi:transglutaminase-like putative cysteine protease